MMPVFIPRQVHRSRHNAASEHSPHQKKRESVIFFSFQISIIYWAADSLSPPNMANSIQAVWFVCAIAEARSYLPRPDQAFRVGIV